MHSDNFGQQIYTENDLCDLYMQGHSRLIKNALIDFDNSFDQLDITPIPTLIKYIKPSKSIEEFDADNQSILFMPDEYIKMDISKWLFDQCKTDVELDRVSKELLMFEERDMIPLLRYLKYLVDTMRKNNVLWGVGRGSSTASYVLFLIGIHRINSILYQLDINEFLK